MNQKSSKFHNNKNNGNDEFSPIPEYWWPYKWFYCDGCGYEWQEQYYQGKSHRPRCPICGDDFWVTEKMKE